MKKTLHLFLLFIFLIFQSSSALAFFSDVPEDHEFYLSIKSLYNLNLLPAFENDLYQPDEYVTKEDLFKFILSYGKSESDIEVELPPSDSANTLPKNYVLAKIFEFLGIGTTYFIQEENFPFIDVKIGTSTSATAMKAAEVGIFENENPTMYKKGRRITKGELAYYLFKVYRYDPGTVSVTYEFDIPSQNSTTAAEDNLLNNKTFSTFADVYSTITNDYYYQDEIDESSLIFGAIKGMIDRLNDQYTVFQEPSEASEFLNTLSPENYEGIGILIELIDNNVTVISPFRGSPAEDAGLKPNDIIKKVDGKSIQDLTLEEIIGLIKGQKGTTVDLSIERNGHNLEFEVKRDFILYSSVQYQILQTNSGKNIGYIELWIFDENATEEFTKAAEALVAEDVDGFLIDLRNNPGGFMEDAINIISLFTATEKTAVQLLFSDGSKEKFKTTGNGPLAEYETVVLINEGSASASEILAGALKDYGIATLVGTTSFGKGTVQQLSEYRDGSIFKYTISKWLTPNGTDINKEGIKPDIKVTNTGSTDTQLKKALEQF